MVWLGPRPPLHRINCSAAVNDDGGYEGFGFCVPGTESISYPVMRLLSAVSVALTYLCFTPPWAFVWARGGESVIMIFGR